jgi:hypothetical protein
VAQAGAGRDGATAIVFHDATVLFGGMVCWEMKDVVLTLGPGSYTKSLMVVMIFI